MKKVLIAVLGILCFKSYVNAGLDKFGSERPAVWRSTRIASTPSNFVLLATGSIIIHCIIVESPTISVDSFFSLFNATGLPQSLSLSTGIGLNTSVYANTTSGAWPGQITYDIPFSSGVVILKNGASAVNMLWDFAIPTTRPGSLLFNP